jgi:hypothetical protein
MDEIGKVAEELTQLVQSYEDKLLGMAERDIRQKKDETSWSIKEIVGHLIDSASNNHQRFIRLQYTKELTFPDYQFENEKWVTIQNYQEEDWNSLVQLWKCFNLHIVHVIRNINRKMLSHIWREGSVSPVSLQDLIVDYLAHFKVHLDQIEAIVKA